MTPDQESAIAAFFDAVDKLKEASAGDRFFSAIGGAEAQRPFWPTSSHWTGQQVSRRHWTKPKRVPPQTTRPKTPGIL